MGDYDAIYPAALALAQRAPVPAQLGNIAFGTSGWTDPSLLKAGTFYPRGTSKPEARLGYYARHFALVEVDASYYTILDPSLAERWLSWTPAAFSFNVKAHASMTGHPVDLVRLPRDLRELAGTGEQTKLAPDAVPLDLQVQLELGFERFITPLRDSGRLGAVLFQFPPWFEATRGNARKLEAVRQRWPGLSIAIEFRNGSWLQAERRDRLMQLLRELTFSYVVVDEPELNGRGVPSTVLVPNPELAVVRLHGQNTEGWRRGVSVAERFNYLYAERELRGWVAPIRRLADEARRVQVIFNNCVRDFGVLNAKGMAALLAEDP